ncbi:uncharacterized protein BXIN_1039 [Babesia sp. Xinjiang]|uniref:uncharacterized protein n=1 Tax=Babesia sp. Xinjiang TaxID=462227 RepID=UPI000A234957|nr:uncharacterized protein BXIN_1039 [Babesia sp. Xinjiang]ORM42015.1 hypothetical protein BXIN_1039 [Babesia sp. Xinjiang]
MGVPVSSSIELFERLSTQYSGACILLKPTERAREKIVSEGYKSCTQLINTALKGNNGVNISVKLEFEEEQDVHEDKDFDTLLLNAVTDNAPEFDTDEIHFVGYTPWFSEWAVTLAKIVRCSRHKTLGIPSDANGITVLCTPDDNVDEVAKLLGEIESTKFRSMVVMGKDESGELIEWFKTVYKEGLILHTVNIDRGISEHSGTTKELATVLRKLVDDCVAHKKAACAAKGKEDVPQVSSKTAKAKLSNADTTVIKSILVAMNDELDAGAHLGYIDDVCRGMEHEIQGVAFVYSALSHIKAVNEVSNSQTEKENGSKVDPILATEKAIADLERAINIFMKFEAKKDALFASVLMATIGGEAETRKLGIISATMELKSKADFVRAALSLELCTFATDKSRKKSFNLVMAGHLYIQAGLINLTKRCYMLAVPVYKDRGWNMASDFLYGTLGRYDPLYCIDALNGLADQFEILNCHKYMKNYDDNFLKSPWYIGDREMIHLRRFMKMSVLDCESQRIKKENATATICAAYGPYPAIVYGKMDTPPLNGDVPYLVRVPFVFLRNKEGVPGNNCELLWTDQMCALGQGNDKLFNNSVDSFELQEAAFSRRVKHLAEMDAAWRPCYDFISDYGNISYRVDPESGYTLPKQATKPATNCPLGKSTVIKLDLVNPLHIGIHCDEFHVLIKDDKESWWQKSTVIVIGNEKNDNFVYLSEGERRIVYLKFTVMKPGLFHICGLAWKLFGCVSCWVPLYLCGPRKTKGAPLYQNKNQSLDFYADSREVNSGLSLSIRDTHPEIEIALSKVTKLPFSAIPLDKNSELFQKVQRYIGISESEDMYNFDEGGNLSMDEAIDGEFVITKLLIKNTGTEPIEKLILNVKTSGECHLANCPIAYISTANNVSVFWEDAAKCNLGSVTGNKSHEVTLRNDAGTLILPNDVMSIFMLMVPRATDGANVLCIQGKLQTSAKCYNSDGNVAFWRFYTIGDGLDLSYDYDHSVRDMVKCSVVNKSKNDIKSLCFYDNSGSLIKKHINNQLASRNTTTEVRKTSSFLSVLPFNPNQSTLTLRWERGNAVGLVTSNVHVDSKARVLVRITSDVSNIRYDGAPILIHLHVILENPTEETIPSLRVEAIRNKLADDIHTWFYVGVLTVDVPHILPKSTVRIGFDVLIPLPGKYFFTYDNINITHTHPVSITPCEQLMVAVE